MELQDRVALITGSGRGIGRAIAQLFAKEGAAVFLTARTEKELASTTAAIATAGGRAAYSVADLSREADCTQIVAAAREKFGKIDVLVNNAGHYGPVVPVEDYPPAEFDKVISIHLRAAFLLSKLVLPEMYARKSGVILNMSRSEEHTSELQSRLHLVCRLLLEKKKKLMNARLRISRD